MYKEYFFLTGAPFLNTPDPVFLFDSQSHKETLASMAYGVLEGKGFVLVTGDVGSGKTLLAQSLKRELDGHVLIEITNPWATPEEVLAAVQSAVGLGGLEGLALWDVLKQRLVELAAEHRRVVLIIDEAQQLPERTLEGLCLLSNLETATEKLIQIVLIGQGELANTLNKHSLRHLYQRITLRACLRRLNREETVRYIQHRLRIVGGSPLLFPADCVDLIFQESQGIPRVINNLCDKCLLFAFGRSSQQVTVQITRDAISAQWPELGLLSEVDASRTDKRSDPTLNADGIQAALPQAKRDAEPEAPVFAGSFVEAPPPQGHADQAFELPFGNGAEGKPNRSGAERSQVTARKGLGFKHLVLTLLLGIVFGGIALRGDFVRLDGLLPWLGKQAPASTVTQPITQSAGPAAVNVPVPPPTVERTAPAAVESPATVLSASASQPAIQGAQAVVANDMKAVGESTISSAPQAEVAVRGQSAVDAPPLPALVKNLLKSREEKISSKNTIDVLAARHYGAWNESVRDLLMTANSELTGLDNLPMGAVLKFPVLTRENLVVKDVQGRNFVYFGSFDKLEFARMNLEAIKRSFSGAELFEADRQGVKLHRLFVGPFVSQSEAQAVANSLWFKYLPILN